MFDFERERDRIFSGPGYDLVAAGAALLSVRNLSSTSL